VKRAVREADNSPPSSAEVKNVWSYTSTPQYAFMAWCLVKQRNNFTFTFIKAVRCNPVWSITFKVVGIDFCLFQIQTFSYSTGDRMVRRPMNCAVDGQYEF
jgi:hypothetical protein